MYNELPFEVCDEDFIELTNEETIEDLDESLLELDFEELEEQGEIKMSITMQSFIMFAAIFTGFIAPMFIDAIIRYFKNRKQLSNSHAYQIILVGMDSHLTFIWSHPGVGMSPTWLGLVVVFSFVLSV